MWGKKFKYVVKLTIIIILMSLRNHNRLLFITVRDPSAHLRFKKSYYTPFVFRAHLFICSCTFTAKRDFMCSVIKGTRKAPVYDKPNEKRP